MDDLISRQALLAEYDRLHVGEPGRARKMIEDAPTAAIKGKDVALIGGEAVIDDENSTYNI